MLQLCGFKGLATFEIMGYIIGLMRLPCMHQCMHNNGSSFALGVETNHPYLSAALPTQALPLPPATPTKTISACTYFDKNNKQQNS